MLVFFGDSNTWGFDPRSYIGGRYPRGTRWTGLVEDALGEKVLNLGLNGRVIPGRGAGLELGEGGRLIIMLGTNDILNGESAAGCARRMARFLSLTPCPPGRLLLTAPVPLERGAWVDGERQVEESRRLAGEYGRLARDIGAHFADAGLWGAPLAYDGVHLTPEGHVKFAEGMIDALGRAFGYVRRGL